MRKRPHSKNIYLSSLPDQSTTWFMLHDRRFITLKLLFSVCFSIYTVHYSFAQSRTVELKPIQKHGWLYFYDFKRVSAAEALQIPLLALNDKLINQYHHSFKVLREAREIVSLVPVAYVLSQLAGQTINARTFWYLLGGSLGANLVFQVWSHHRMGLAINRYNLLLLPASTSRIDSPRLPGLALTIKL